MTQYSEKVENYRQELQAVDWGKEVKYLHAHRGIFEIAYNNGEIHFEETKTGRKWIEGKIYTKKSLIQRFGKFMADARAGVDPYGK
jgi:hypothetical protein